VLSRTLIAFICLETYTAAIFTAKLMMVLIVQILLKRLQVAVLTATPRSGIWTRLLPGLSRPGTRSEMKPSHPPFCISSLNPEPFLTRLQVGILIAAQSMVHIVHTFLKRLKPFLKRLQVSVLTATPRSGIWTRLFPGL
jgi:hypothetical protein